MPVMGSSVAARTSIQRTLGEHEHRSRWSPHPGSTHRRSHIQLALHPRFLARNAQKNTSCIVVAIPPAKPQSPGARILSTRASIDAGGGGVNFETTVATTKLSTMPTAPMPSGEMPNSQYSSTFRSGRTNLKKTM